MSHLFESGLFVGQPAWHGLGVVLQNAPTIVEALTVAGLDWTVTAEPAFTADGSRVPDCQIIRRGSDGKIFAHMGKIYNPLQNVDALGRFQPLIDSGLATIEAAGSLDEGRKIWVLARVQGASGEVVKGDRIDQYVLLAHSHDGTLKIWFGFTSTRVVCNNTLQVALGDVSRMVSVKHTKNAVFKLDEAAKQFDMAGAKLGKDLKQYKFLASKKCDDALMTAYARTVLAGVERAQSEEKIRNEEDLVRLFHTGQGNDMPGVRGTMWAAYNAATEYLTHEAGRSQDTRVTSGWFGPNAKRGAIALNVATAFAEVAPDATSLARECSQNTALASASFSELLGGSFTPPADDGADDFARLLGTPIAAE